MVHPVSDGAKKYPSLRSREGQGESKYPIYFRRFPSSALQGLPEKVLIVYLPRWLGNLPPSAL
jgi:hypothetical protein